VRLREPTVCLTIALLVASACRCLAQDTEVAQLAKDLRSGDLEARLTSAFELLQLGPKAEPALPALVEALSDRDEGVRMLAATALGAIGPRAAGAVEALRKTLNDPDPDVSAAARLALEQIASSGGPLPASTTGAQGAAASGALPARTRDQPGLPAQPIPGEAGAAQEELESAIRALLTQGSTMGLLDDAGNQLNPNVPPDAVSLRMEDVRTHAALIAQGQSRTIRDVTDFLGQLGATLRSTGQPVTAEDIVPELQTYVDWCYQNPQDASATMGLALAAGPGLAQPPATPPVLSPETEVSPLAASMELVELLSVGLSGERATSLGRLRRLVNAIALADRARGTDPDLRVRYLKVLVHLFEVTSRLAIRVTWADDASASHAVDGRGTRTTAQAGSTLSFTGILFDEENQHVALRAMAVGLPNDTPLRHQRLLRYTLALGQLDSRHYSDDRVSDSRAMLVPGPPDYGDYQVLSATHRQLTVDGAPDPFFIRCTRLSDRSRQRLLIRAEARWQDIEPLIADYWPSVSISGMDFSEAEELLRRWAITELRPAPASVVLWFRDRQAPDLVIARAEGWRREVAGGKTQVRSTVTVRNAGDGPTDPQGTIEVKLRYVNPRGGDPALALGSPRAGELGAGETWEVDAGWQDWTEAFEPTIVEAIVYYKPAATGLKEASEGNNSARYGLASTADPAKVGGGVWGEVPIREGIPVE
jgi:hypothetical protein